MTSQLFFYLIFYTIICRNIVLGYGYKAHEYLGGTNDKYLSLYEPIIYRNITDLIGGDLRSVSSWADKIKRNSKYTWTAKLHYIDIVECNNGMYDKDIINKYCENNCIVSIIKDLVNSLKYNKEYLYKVNNNTLSRSEQLKFLIHFIQDFNQPMHLLGYDRGGNSLKINMYMDGKNKTTNLHYIWDSLLPEYYIHNYLYTVPFEKVKLPVNFTVNNLLETILNENIKEISCKIYPKTSLKIIYLDFNDYFKDEYLRLLFDNYHKMSILILKYIFE